MQTTRLGARLSATALIMLMCASCELLPIEPAEGPPPPTVCDVDAQTLQRLIEQYMLIEPDATGVTEELLVERGLLPEPMINADVRKGKAVPSPACTPTPTTIAAPGPTAVAGPTTLAPPISIDVASTVPAVPATAPKWFCDGDLAKLKRAIAQFGATAGRPPASEAELIAAGLLTAESTVYDVAADGTPVAVPGSGC